MKLTKNGLENGGVFYDVEDLENIFQNYPDWKEKARKWDEDKKKEQELSDSLYERALNEIANQKLRELIEKELNELLLTQKIGTLTSNPDLRLQKAAVADMIRMLQKLLEESKK